PEAPGFRSLPILAGAEEHDSKALNREALRRLQAAHGVGFSADALAELYNHLKLQIEQACPGWRAQRIKCSDLSHGFIGALGPVLVIQQNREIYLGHLGATAADGLLYYTELVPLADHTLAFPPPCLTAPGTRRLCG
ncbi:MAG TPA: hypothetical protein VMF89_20950, partial [Polyangiales bacterium]|nr:hypothetical protein [Polyangiales bacterium]